jgi:hypothetical protein
MHSTPNLRCCFRIFLGWLRWTTKHLGQYSFRAEFESTIAWIWNSRATRPISTSDARNRIPVVQSDYKGSKVHGSSHKRKTFHLSKYTMGKYSVRELHLLGYNAVESVESQTIFRKNTSLAICFMCSCLAYFPTLMMEAAYSSEESVEF